MRLNLPVSNIEFTLPDGVVIVTKTDLKGVITYCNKAFVEISGRSRDEIIGARVRLRDTPPVNDPAACIDFAKRSWTRMERCPTAGHLAASVGRKLDRFRRYHEGRLETHGGARTCLNRKS